MPPHDSTAPSTTGVAPRQVRLALVQMTCVAARQPNVDEACRQIAAAAGRQAQVVCLPELFAGLYFCQTEDFAHFEAAEPIPGPTTEALARAAREHGVVVLTSIFERRAPGVYHNTAVVLDADGRLAGVYRKMHIPDDPHFYEKFYFTPGDLGFQSFPTRFGRIGVCVCWDQWFPEAARLTAMTGAHLIVYPTAIGWLPEHDPPVRHSQHQAWETIMRGHAIANGVYVAAVNRTGTEGELEFWGASFVSDPFGTVVARASHHDAELVLVDCDFNLLDDVRTHWPFLRDRRIDAYGDLTKRYLA